MIDIVVSFEDGNLNVARFLGKRLVRICWMLLLLAAAQLAGALMAGQPPTSRTAAVPPLSAENVALQRHSLH
ncbi:hypothetical protein [Maricaulis sp.]|uniref:hypothetical protein n=1 Tax=Maricaulis sp. TaxID=1486257 RepID=UPI003A911EC0